MKPTPMSKRHRVNGARAWPCFLLTVAACAQTVGASRTEVDDGGPAQNEGQQPPAAVEMDAADVPPRDECDTHPESPCCKTWPAVASGALIEQASADGLYPLRAVAFEREQCGFYVAGFDADGGKGRIAVSRFSALTGAPLWTQTFATEGSGSAYHMTVGPDGEVVVAGGTAWLGDRKTERAFLHVLSPEGEDLWKEPRTLGPGDYTDARDVAVRSDGVIAMIGNFNGGQPQSTYVALFGPEGEPLWPEPFTSADFIEGGAVVFAPDGSLVLGGRESLLEDGTLSMLRLDDRGTPTELAPEAFAGPDGPVFSPSIALDHQRNLVVATCHAPDDVRRPWLQKFTLEGRPLWPQPVSPDWGGHVIMQDVAVSDDDEIAVVGTIQAEIPGLRDLLVMLFDTDGEALWEAPFIFDGAGQPLSFGDNSDDLGWAVDFDHAGNVIVVGWSEGGRAFLARIAR